MAHRRELILATVLTSIFLPLTVLVWWDPLGFRYGGFAVGPLLCRLDLQRPGS